MFRLVKDEKELINSADIIIQLGLLFRCQSFSIKGKSNINWSSTIFIAIEEK